MDKLCNTSILSTENLLFTSFYYCLRRVEGRLYLSRFRVYSELCGSGSFRAERSGDQEALGRNGPRVRKPSGGMIQGSGNLKVERSGKRRQECSSEHVAWTPRPRTWRLFLCARAWWIVAPRDLAGAPRRACPRGAEHSSERPGAIPAQRASEPRRALGVSIRLRTPRPCTGGQVLTGNDSACQLNFVSKRLNLSICWVCAP